MYNKETYTDEYLVSKCNDSKDAWQDKERH